MNSPLSENDRTFLDDLHRLGSATVTKLCDELNVTATAVRQRLSRLQSLGFVAREADRVGRGRPRYTYRVTGSGLRQLGDNYSDLAIILWQTIREIEEPAIRERAFGRIRDHLATRFGRTIRPSDGLAARASRLGSELRDAGFSVEVDLDGNLPVLREHNCPYHDLAESDPGICELEQAVFEQVLGTEMELTQCCLDGHQCCEFQPSGMSSESGIG